MNKTFFLLLLIYLMLPNSASARLEVCNKTDLVLMIAVGYDTYEGRVASEGWWKLYPGFCRVPVDLSLLEGNYYVHAESNRDTTLPDDELNWGNQLSLCLALEDYRFPDAKHCTSENSLGQFNEVNKNWRNTNIVEINHPRRQYENEYRIKVAGVQRLLSILGYDVGEIDGLIGQKTVIALDQIANEAGLLAFDFNVIYPHLEKLITQKKAINY